MVIKMDLAEVYRGLGPERFEELLKAVSMGSLKTYQVFESFRAHARLQKLNRANLRKAAPRLWERVQKGDADLAREVAQGVLVSNLSFVVEALDFLGIPHDGNGFFDKDGDLQARLEQGWRQKLFEHFRGRYPDSLILLYINHLGWELGSESAPFLGS